MMENLNEGLDLLKPKEKEPHSVSVLSKWIDMAENQMGSEKTGRLAWLVASSVVIAKLQQVVDAQGEVRFVLKGGTLLQYRLGLAARATKDIDGIVRGDIDGFLKALDMSMKDLWGPIGFYRSEIEEIKVPSKTINPRRLEVSLTLRGKTWRRVQVEVSPDEGNAGSSFERFKPPSLAGFGLPTPDAMVGLALSYQIAQKIHAASDPHDPPDYVNRRARDVVDLMLLKQLTEETGKPTLVELATALGDVFASRAEEAEMTGRKARALPTKVVAHRHWVNDYKDAASSAAVELTLEAAVDLANAWIELIEASHNSSVSF